MTLANKKKVLTDYLNMKVIQEDWHGVSDAANDLREIEIAIRIYNSTKIELKDYSAPLKESAPPSQAIPPVEMEIPHHENEVLNLLKLNDNALVDKLFPDYSQMQPGIE